MKNLLNKVAVVTGAAMGMGKLFSEMLLEEGCKVALIDINIEALQNTIDDLSFKSDKTNFKAYTCDITDRTRVEEVFASIKRDFGPILLLINNAGIVDAGDVLNVSDESILRQIEVNLISQFWTIKAVIPDMIAAKEGHIVNIASLAGYFATPSLAAYSASKFGVLGLSDALRQELKDFNIGVTVVCPTFVSTGMFEGIKQPMISPLSVVRPTIKAVKKNKTVISIPRGMKQVIRLGEIFLGKKGLDYVFRRIIGRNFMKNWVGRN